MYHRPRKSFRTHRMVLLGYEAQMAAHFVCLDIVVILTQDRCMLCAVHTLGSEIILDALYGTPMLRGSYGISFRSVWMQDWSTVRTKST
jgi:hypothetical protein